MQIETNIENELFEWGKWARNCPSKSLGYPHQTPFNQFRGSSVSSSRSISDERALDIDQALAKLFNNDADTLMLIIGRFQYCLSYRELNERTDISKDKARLLVENAISWVSGYFVGKRMAA
jgi:hypothetical protein